MRVSEIPCERLRDREAEKKERKKERKRGRSVDVA